MNQAPVPILAVIASIILASTSVPAWSASEPAAIAPETVKKWSAPYRGWHHHPDHVIPAKPEIKGFEGVKMTDVPTVFQVPGDKKWHMTFIGFDGKGYQSFIAESDDLLNWTNRRLAMGYGPEGEFDHGGVVLGAYLYESYDIRAPRVLKKKDGKYWSLYGAYPRQGGYELRPGYEGVAASKDGLSWERAQDEPILSIYQEDCGEWEKSCIYMPWLVEHDGRYLNFYNAANGKIEQTGLALSDDLLKWKRHANNPVIPVGPDGSYNQKFSADPKVFRDGDHWVNFFFGVGKDGAHIMAAFSRDLIHWTVDPEPLYKAGGNPSGLDKQYAHKISLVWNPANETFYMYYNAVGNQGRGIGLITSKPLANQTAAALKPNPFTALPLGSVTPKGWLKDTLRRAADGLTGNLDTIYSEVVGPANGWLGGDGDVWERGPYWIDGLLPLAYLLDDPALKQKVQPWIEWTLENQREDGYLGPRPGVERAPSSHTIQTGLPEDWWPRMPMLKVLQNYYSATGDKCVPEALDRYFRYQLKTLPSKPLGKWSHWARIRGGDNILVVLWLYRLTGETYLLDLARLIDSQMYQHTDEWLKEDSPLTTTKAGDLTHCVNISQALKHPLMMYQLDRDERHIRAVEKALSDLDRLSGMPTGLFAADEILHGNAPTVGTEFCAISEMLFSLQNMVRITGRVDWADRMEQIAFNVLPTQASDDFSGKQYYSMVNQPLAADGNHYGHRQYYKGTDSFGVLTGYPCCLCNMHQAWPKFAQNLWMSSADGGLAAVAYAPCEVNTKLAGGTTVRIEQAGNYPFGETVTLQLHLSKAASFPLHLRIPTWCANAKLSINGGKAQVFKGGRFARIDRTWEDGDQVTLHFPMKLISSRWHRDTVSFQRGPLLLALPVESRMKETGQHGTSGYYREYFPTGSWNYGILQDDLGTLDTLFSEPEVRPVGVNPWTETDAPLRIRTRGVRIPDWNDPKSRVMPPSPVAVQAAVPGEITLIPYGCTILRIAEFPTVIPIKIEK